MSYLARLKNLKSTQTDTAKPTKPGFAGFAAPIPAPFENSRGGFGEVDGLAAGLETMRSVATVAVATPENLRAANDPTARAVTGIPISPPAPASTDWKALDKAYQAHHVNCPTCIAAGKGYGLRCGVGAALWAAYDATDMPLRGQVSAGVIGEVSPRVRTEAHTVDPLLTDTGNPASAARLALFDARGLTAADAERLVSKLLVRDREGDNRGCCAECRQLVGNGPGRWRCADQSPSHINELAGANLGAAFVHLNLHRCNSIKGAAS